MPKKNNAQFSIEFIMLISFMFLVFLGFIAVVTSRIIEAKENERQQIAEDIAALARNEIDIAKSMTDGYARNFAIPAKIKGNSYTIKIINDRELVVKYLDKEYVEFLPEKVVGNVNIGLNEISKIGNTVYIRNIGPECSDESDNDGDSLIDLNDPGCSVPTDNDETNCGDSVCEGPENCLSCSSDCVICVECVDSIDNDGDAYIDLADPGCLSASDTSELGTVECDDNLDNDMDGAKDYPNDNGCSVPTDNDETNCGDSVCEGPENCLSCSSDCVICDVSCPIPTNTICKSSTVDAITLQWDDIAGANSYSIEWCPSGKPFNDPSCNTGTSANELFTAGGLSGGSAYNLRVRVQDASTCKAPSDWSTIICNTKSIPFFSSGSIYDIATDSGGNVIAVGDSGGVFLTEKYANDGTLLWKETYDWPARPASDRATAVAIDSNDNIVVAGTGTKNVGPWQYNFDIVWVKYGPNGGSPILQDSFCKTPDPEVDSCDVDDNEEAYGVSTTPSGKIVITGTSDRSPSLNGIDVVIIFSPGSYSFTWKDGTDVGTGIVGISYKDNDDIIQESAVVSAYDDEKYLVWSGGLLKEVERGKAMAITKSNDNNIIVAGETGWSDFPDYMISKFYILNGWIYMYNGWPKTYTSGVQTIDHASDVVTDSQNNILVTGDTMTIKLTPDGTEIWRKSISGDKVAIDPHDNIFILSGVIKKYNSNGEVSTDTTPPIISVSHLPASPLSFEQVTITAIATDNVGIASINMYVDGVLVKKCATSPCTYTGGPYAAGSTHTYYATTSDVDGNIARAPVTGTKSFSVSPPPNKKIVYVAGTTIMIMNADGSSQTPLTTGGRPAISPIGTKIAFSRLVSGYPKIFVMNADGSGERQLTTGNYMDTSPVWSPDGTKIAYASEQGGDYEIFVMNADGSGQTPLTFNTVFDIPTSWYGDYIYFYSDNDGDYDIWSIPSTGGVATRFVDLAGSQFSPSISPDGTKIAFSSNEGGARNIYTINTDGSNKQIVTGTVWGDYPDWLDNTRIIFSTGYYSISDDIYSITSDGVTRAQLTTNLDTEFEPNTN